MTANPPDLMRMTTFTVDPGVRWEVDLVAAQLPPRWVELLHREYRRRPRSEGKNPPTSSLRELLIGLDPAVLSVHWKLDAEDVIWALPGVDAEILTAGIAAWATTEINLPNTDIYWWDELDHSELIVKSMTVDLLAHAVHPNGTTNPASAMFRLLPSFLAMDVVTSRLPLLGKERDFILGPPSADGDRAAVLWPPETLHDKKSGDQAVTAKITFHIETAPNDPVPHVHADLSISRFPLNPVAYVPARGDGPPKATVWLHAPEGFLRQNEPHTLLAARAEHAFDTAAEKRRWRWTPGLARALDHLTHLTFPNPDDVLTDPLTATTARQIQARVLYSEGSKSTADPDEDAEPPADGVTKARSLAHAANTGLVPDDHLDAHSRLGEIVRPRGISPLPDLGRIGSAAARLLRPADTAGQTYTIEVWTQSDKTMHAVLAAVEHGLELTPVDGSTDRGTFRFGGDIDLVVTQRPAGAVADGITRKAGDERATRNLVRQHADHIARLFGTSEAPTAVILELDDDKHFARMGQIDPKPALKKAFATSGRRLQCLRPVKEFVPPTKPPREGQRPKAPYPGTNLAVESGERAEAAVRDALRQLGRVGTYAAPAQLPEFEQIGIWLHHGHGFRVPIVIRLGLDGHATAHLLPSADRAADTVDYRDLPKALASGHGRVRGSAERQRTEVARFLANALGVGDTASKDRHHRLVFVRSASFRNWGWDWLQDKNVTPDRLVLPGARLGTDEPPPPILLPDDCPGLRIIRVRERGSQDEVGRGFGAPGQRRTRISGVFGRTDRLFYSINPRPAQMQTPLKATKLDPDILSNHTLQVSNPAPLEILAAFLQPGDDPAEFATFASMLRRSHLHTDQATRFPIVLRLCELAEEYL